MAAPEAAPSHRPAKLCVDCPPAQRTRRLARVVREILEWAPCGLSPLETSSLICRKLRLLRSLIEGEKSTWVGPVAYEIAKLLLEYAGTFVERTEAIKVAISLGMPLSEIEEYLDWLDSVRPPSAEEGSPPRL